MVRIGEPFCHEHSAAMLTARAVTAAAARAALLMRAVVICAGVMIVVIQLALPWPPHGLGLAAAGAATPAKSTCGLTIDVSHPAAGIAISAVGVASVQTFDVYLEPRLLGQLKSDRTGHLAGRLTLPADARGPQTLQVGSRDCAIAVTFDADGGPPNGPPPPPPPPAQQAVSAPPPIQVGLSDDLRYGLIALVVTTAVLMLLLTSRLGRRASPRN